MCDLVENCTAAANYLTIIVRKGQYLKKTTIVQ